MEGKPSDKYRRERRKDARLAKNKRKFESWVQYKQSWKAKKASEDLNTKKESVDLNTASARKLLKDDAINDCTQQSLIMEKSKTKVKDLKSNGPMIDNLSEHRHTLDSSIIRKDLKRKKGLDKTPKSNFSRYVQMEMEGRSIAAEEDLRFERRLAKKLKVKNGRLSVANDDIDVLLEGIPSVLDNLGEIQKVSKSIENGTLSRKREKINSVNEDLDDTTSVEEGDGNSDSLASSEGCADEDVDDEISVEEGDEESDSLSSREEDVNEDVDDKILVQEGDEESDSLASSEEDAYEDVDDRISVEGNEQYDSLASMGDDDDDVVEVISQRDSNKGKRKKTKFEEYLATDIQGGKSMAKADLALERQLARKLKVKAGKVHGDDDEINMLLDGIPSVLDSLEDKQIQNPVDYPKKSPKLKNSKSIGQEQKAETRISSKIEASEISETFSPEVALENFQKTGTGKYVAPHLRSHGGNESAEHAQVRRRVRGLLNRLSETNVESITGEISTIFHSVGRIVGSQIISEEVITSCSSGPRGNDQYAAVFAAFVVGMACLVGIDFGAKVLACLAKCFEEEYLKEDNLSLRNLTLLFSYLYVFGLCSSDLVYDFLITLGKRLTEVDVSTVLTVLQCCGMKLRGDDPVEMKNFISNVQIRVNELKASSGGGQSNLSSKRMEFMIETICDIKNNKKRSKEDTVQHTRIKKWLQKLRVDDILIRRLKWSRLLNPSMKGQWWLSGEAASTTENIEEVAGTIDKEVTETKKMLQLAASQRMNTDARRAIFCVIMSADDYIDAFEKILRLDLTGKQDREIMRVLVECCLQEKVFNKYYCVLASKLCSYDKNHKFTLQYCLWDHFKELESMPLIRSMHLSKFVAEMVASFSLSLAVLKAVDLNDPIHLSPKRIMHFRMLFEAIFELPDKLVWNIFTRIAVTSEYESLRSGVEFFIRKYVTSVQKSLTSKFKIARKALNNIEGIVM